MSPLLFNRTTGRQVIDHVRIAKSLWAQFQGLMLESPGNFDYALIFPLPLETRLGASVHMLFVFFPLDLVFLDKNRRVVDKKEGFRPFSLNYTPKKPAAYFVEMPAGLAKEIRLGDELVWES